MEEMIMETKNLKNLDRQVAGRACYNTSKGEWVSIVEVKDAECLVENEDGEVYWEEREFLYPKAEKLHVANDKDLNVCYEMSRDVDYRFYCPETDENLYEFEVISDKDIRTA